MTKRKQGEQATNQNVSAQSPGRGRLKLRVKASSVGKSEAITRYQSERQKEINRWNLLATIKVDTRSAGR